MRLFLLPLCWVSLLVLTVPARALELTPAARAKALVRELGDASYTVREEAARKILLLGPAAKTALQEGLQSNDLEVQARCERLLVTVLEQDFQLRLDAFLADKEGNGDHDLPGWQRYRQIVGRDAGARELYAEMAKTHRLLMEEAEAAPKTVGARLAGECQALFQKVNSASVAQRRQITLADVATILLIATDPEAAVSDQGLMMAANLLYQPAFNQTLRAGARSEQARKLFLAWAGQVKGNAANQTLNIAMQYNLKEGLDLGLRLIREKDWANGMAIVAIGKLGTKEHLPLLEPLLDNTAVIMNVNFNNKPGTTEVRDVALAMMVHLTGQSIKDYGFEFFRGTTNAQVFFAPVYLAFAEKAKRDAAHQKFRDWAKANIKP